MLRSTYFTRALTSQVHRFFIALIARIPQVSNAETNESIIFRKTWLDYIIEVTIRPLIKANMACIT